MNPIVDVERILDDLVTETGLENVGDPTYRDGLDAFTEALQAQARPNEIGRGVAAGMVRTALLTRLLVEQWWSDHPELETERIEAPVFIVGMSRSGTTALSHLLARDPRNRSLLGWEASQPVPPPQRDAYAADSRYLAARAQEFGGLEQLNPALTSMHHDPPDMPVECLVLMAQHFVSLSFPLLFHMPSYVQWVREVDHAPAYRWHERVLRLLQSGGVRGRWQLKSPHHSIALAALVKQYPDARFVVTHRDPAACVASSASLAREFAGTLAEPRDGTEFGELWAGLLVAMGDGIMKYRSDQGDGRFIDVSYRQLTADPIGAVRQIYDQLGESVAPTLEAALRAHAEAAVQHRFGRHEYGWEEFGLRREALDARFAAYRERFEEFLS